MQKLLLLTALIWSVCCTKAQNFSGNAGAIPGTSTSQSCFSATVSGVGPINAGTIGLESVCIHITHPNVDELEILLSAPDGTVVPLSIQNGGSGNNYAATCFTATAASSIKFANAPFAGSFLPEGYLGAVNNGQNADGTWSLCVQDRRNGGNSGSLVSWSLSFGNAPAPLPPSIPACSTTLPGTSSCTNATAVCDFNGLCGNTTGSSVLNWPGSGLNNCFNLENNTFIKFEAAAATVSFTIWVPTSSTGSDGGIQMMFFSGTCGSGAVTSYGCYPHIFPYQSASNPIPTIVSATGLTPGDIYYLMIDGHNNDECTFTIAASTGINILNATPSALVICEGDSVNMAASGGNGAYTWSPATGLNSTTGTTVTASPPATTLYTLTSTNSLGCSLTRDITVTVNEKPIITTQPISTTQRICEGGPITALSVAATPGSGTITGYQWYITTNPANAGAPWPGAIANTFSPSTANVGTIYFYCIITNSNGCSTTSDVSGAVIISPKVNAPVASATVQPTCLLPVGTITVTSPFGANFEYSTGGAYQASGIFANLVPASYNVTVKNIVTGCISPATAVTINAAPVRPALPVAAVTVQPDCIISTGTISVTGPIGASIEYSTGGAYQAAPVFAGLTNGTLYPVTAKDIITGCVSDTLLLAVDPIAGAPAAPTGYVSTAPDCNIVTGTITLTGPIGTDIEYSINNGPYQASTVFTNLTAGASYTFTARNNATGCVSVPVSLVMSNTTPPSVPLVTNTLSYCQDEIAPSLTATGSNLLWYTAASGGIGSSTAPIPQTTTAANSTYYVSQTINACESQRIGITVTVKPTPSVPNVTDPVVYCQDAAAAALTATGSNLLWYSASTGGTGIISAFTPQTSVPGNTIYYVSQTINGCESPRATITVTINPIPAAPIVVDPVDVCQDVTGFALTATGNNLLWYSASTGGTGNASAFTPQTSVPGNTTYYVSQTVLGCESPRTGITVTVKPTPALPVVTNQVTYCQNTPSTALTATGSSLLWYTVSAGGTGSAVAIVPSTSLPGNIIYYATQTVNGCESPRAGTAVTVYATPATPQVVSPVTYCQYNTASMLTATGSNLLWYNTSTGETGTATAPTPLTDIPGNTFYYVSQTINGCEGPRIAITVTINKDSTAVTSFIYAQDTICINGFNNPGPAYATGFTNGGVFSSSPGLSISPANGDISLAGSTPGTYLVKYTYNTTGCIQGGSSTAMITLNPAVSTITLFSYSSPVCKNDGNPMPSTIAGFTTGGTFLSSPGIVVKPATGEVDLAASSPGSYVITYNLPVLGCRMASNSFSFLNIVDTTRPVTKFSYSPAITCITASSNPVLVKVPGFTSFGTFSATPSGLSINASTGAITIGLSTPGTYKVKYTVPKFLCRLADSDSTMLTINSYGTPVTDFSYFSPVCQGDTSASAVLSSGFTKGGIFSSTPGLVINPVSGMVDLVQSVPGSYIVTYAVEAGECNPAGSSAAPLNILTQPPPPDVTPVSLCGPGDAALTASSLGTIKWYTEKELVNQVNVGNILSTLLEITTSYYLTNTVGSCESKAAALTAVVNPLPEKPFIGNDTAICSTDKLILNPGLYNNYLWQDGSTQQVVTANTAGNYKVVVSTKGGCADSASIHISLLDNCDDVYFPSAFSPNGDQLNAKFGALGNLFIISNYSLRIFNRFGEVVFSTRNPYDKWDGTHKGKVLGMGNFVYVASYTYKNRLTKTRKGSLVIVR